MSQDPIEAAADCETVTVEDDESGVATVVLNRPEARNAMNEQLREELKRVLAAVDDSDARVVVVTGSEQANAFVAGADIQDFRDRSYVEQRRASKRQRVYEAIASLRQPVLARINGHALGGGLELALACDVRIARDSAMLGQPEITLGLMPGGGATQRLPRLVGEGKAMELVLSGEPVDATEAARIGLVDDVVPSDELDDRVYGLAESMAGHSTVALAYAKESVKAAASMPLEQGLEYERELFAGLFAAGEKDEGIDAFFENREPRWKW